MFPSFLSTLKRVNGDDVEMSDIASTQKHRGCCGFLAIFFVVFSSCVRMLCY